MLGFLLFFGGIFLLFIACLLSSECVIRLKSVWGNVFEGLLVRKIGAMDASVLNTRCLFI